MILGSWQNIKLICGNHGEDHSNEMILQEGKVGMSTFYACPCFQSILKKEIKGRSCNNRLTIVDYEKMLNHLMNEKIDDDCNETILKGLEWKNKGIEYKVLSEENNIIKVRMLNKKAIQK